MFIANDLGNEIINLDLVFALGVTQAPDGQSVLLAQGVSKWQSALVVGSKERCEQAFAAIRKGVKDRQHIVDLIGLLGQRPDISVAQTKIVLPGNGEGRP